MAAGKSFDAFIEDLRSGVLSPREALSEAAFYALWQKEGLSRLAHLTMPLVGGAMADRLPWVFLSGYQGMIRYAFPFSPDEGWASYLLTEDRTGEFPGTTLSAGSEGQVLSGNKSWVAASDHADHLIVRIGKGPIDPLICIGRDAEGVTLTAREKPGFLADMSQGFAGFDNVAIPKAAIFGTDQTPLHFAVSEPWHALMAMNAFMASHTVSLADKDGAGHDGAGHDSDDSDHEIVAAAILTLQKAHGLETAAPSREEFVRGVYEIDEATTKLAAKFEAFITDKDPDLLARFQKDRGFINMFSADLKRRFARAMA